MERRGEMGRLIGTLSEERRNAGTRAQAGDVGGSVRNREQVDPPQTQTHARAMSRDPLKVKLQE